VFRRGVMGPEACFEPIGFFAELVQRWGSRMGTDLVTQDLRLEPKQLRQGASGRG
jgi:hypothetical protein